MHRTPPHPIQSPHIVILVTGDRHAQYDAWAELIALEIWKQTQGQPYELVHGDAAGIDRVAAEVAYHTIGNWGMSCLITAFPADWNQYGRGAGPRRNAQMRDYLLERQREGARVICLAFHPDLASSKGTGNMVKLARAAGIPVETFDGRSVD